MRKLEHCTSRLPQSSIVDYSLCCNEAKQSCNTSYASQEKKRKVLYAMFEKWRHNLIVALRLSRG